MNATQMNINAMNCTMTVPNPPRNQPFVFTVVGDHGPTFPSKSILTSPNRTVVIEILPPDPVEVLLFSFVFAGSIL